MIIQKYIPTKTKRRSGQKLLGVLFITAHDTGNPNSTAMGNVDYFIKSANEMEASAHTFIDDVNTIECIPLSEKAWHVIRNVTTDNTLYGGDANDYALGIELCYFPQDIERTKLAYLNYINYIKGLCQLYGLDPAKHVIGHYQLDPARKKDPMNAFNVIGKTWEQFIKDLTPKAVDKDKIKKEITRLLDLI